MEQENKFLDRKAPGRPIGSRNKLGQEIRHILAGWAETELRNVSELYAKLSPKEKSRFITNILPFVIPKMKEVDIELAVNEHQIDDVIKRLLDGGY